VHVHMYTRTMLRHVTIEIENRRDILGVRPREARRRERKNSDLSEISSRSDRPVRTLTDYRHD